MADEEKNEARAIEAHDKLATEGATNAGGQGRDIDLEARGEEHGYVLNVEVLKTITPKWRSYQLASDGQTVLIPQPSTDSNDPLTWSWQKKHAILFVIAATAFLPDYGSAVGAVTLIPQSAEWGIPQDVVNHSQVGNVFMLGAGGVFVVALAAYFGRLPILFWFTFTALWTAAGCAGSATFESFMAFRILNGFFSTVAQGGGLMFIKDLFFLHERARKTNVWASFVILSPYFGPLITAFIISTQKWQVAFTVYTCMTGHLGLGSVDCQPGDELCVFADGGRTPFLVRELASGGRAEHSLLGEAYVREFMQGVAVEELEAQGSEWRSICLV